MLGASNEAAVINQQQIGCHVPDAVVLETLNAASGLTGVPLDIAALIHLSDDGSSRITHITAPPVKLCSAVWGAAGSVRCRHQSQGQGEPDSQRHVQLANHDRQRDGLRHCSYGTCFRSGEWARVFDAIPRPRARLAG